MKHIAIIASLQIPSEAHELVAKRFNEKDPNLTMLTDFKQVQNSLLSIQKENNLEGDVYTYIRGDRTPDSLVLLSTTNNKVSIGFQLPFNLAAIGALKEGVPTHTGLYADSDGTWIAGFAPIFGKTGKVIGGIGITDRTEGTFIKKKNHLLATLSTIILLGIAASVLVGGSIGYSFHHSYSKLLETYQSSQSQYEEESGQAEKTSFELKLTHQILDTLLESSQQGYLLFTQTGACLETHSSRLEEILGTRLSGKPIWEILHQTEEQGQKWCRMLFQELIPFEQVAALAPKAIGPSEKKGVSLRFFPLRDSSGDIATVLLLATDRRSEYEADRAAEREKAYAEMLIKLTKNKERSLSFIQEINDTLLNLESELESSDPSHLNLEAIYRGIHTLKGDAAWLSLTRLQELAQNAESQLSHFIARKQVLSNSSVSEISDTISDLRQAFQSFLKENRDILNHIPILTQQEEPITDLLSNETEPIQTYFTQFDSFVSRLARKQGKEINPIHFRGGNLPIVALPYSDLFSSMVHVFRNAILSRIESPIERKLAGKPEKANITVYFARKKEGNQSYLKIAVLDDGRGIPPEELSHLNTSDCRGISQVKTATEKQGGTVTMYSKKGAGTMITITIPEMTPEITPQLPSISA